MRKILRIVVLLYVCNNASASLHPSYLSVQPSIKPPSFISVPRGKTSGNNVVDPIDSKLNNAGIAIPPNFSNSDVTIHHLREELKSRLLEAADEFMSMKAKSDEMAVRAQELSEQKEKEKWFVLRILSKILRKITRRNNSNPKKIGILSKEAFSQKNLDVGAAGETVIALAEELSKLNPTAVPLIGFKGQYGAPPSESKLGGYWKLRFTTAADASFSASKERGIISTSQVIDARKGTLTNVIDFEKGNLKGFRVVVQGEPFGPDILDLSFTKIHIFRKSRFPRLFGHFTIWLPSRLIRFLASWGKQGAKPSGPYLKIRYLDNNLRMHTTDKGNWFIQSRLD
mmetsp:Transcript_6363/g.13092  ORF Transcript_6363/g.13092 Transcript_6363/m.13092 type:complete len:341 (+) Transcript_6363:185-1207(+)